ncbi:hypothetical protein AYI68_g992 [Smittium mucronatum]|uniref:Cytochrome b-c1 complex subunit 10 n=1 Tax=Smittium mucronatum TaxID=133383 RepID=A0A1R0H6R8_9FUNG|nr:hypothetical protein AYI68_g992 [Smittium mucronatum]
MKSPSPHVIYKPQGSVSRFTTERARYWMKSGAMWTGFAGITVLLLASQVPVVKRDIMSQVPYIGDYWKVEEE